MLAAWLKRRNEFPRWEYVPGFWTELRIYHADADWLAREAELRRLLEARITGGRRGFAVVQHDLGLPCALPTAVEVFGTSVGPHYIPLLKQPLPRERETREQPIPVSFVGRAKGDNDLNELRSRMLEAGKRLERFRCADGLDYAAYCDLLRQSVFTLAPRGYGPTSFRLYEAMAMRSIPVYIWEGECCLPFANELDWDRLAVIVAAEELPRLGEILAACGPERRAAIHAYTDEVYERSFTYNGVIDRVFDRLRRWEAGAAKGT